jgi:hypothetical protein
MCRTLNLGLTLSLVTVVYPLAGTGNGPRVGQGPSSGPGPGPGWEFVLRCGLWEHSRLCSAVRCKMECTLYSNSRDDIVSTTFHRLTSLRNNYNVYCKRGLGPKVIFDPFNVKYTSKLFSVASLEAYLSPLARCVGCWKTLMTIIDILFLVLWSSV